MFLNYIFNTSEGKIALQFLDKNREFRHFCLSDIIEQTYFTFEIKTQDTYVVCIDLHLALIT